MKKILLIGNGAREHVIAETFMKSRHEVELYIVGKTLNPGIAKLAKEYLLADVCDLSAIKEFAEKFQPDFAFVGPEAPIEAGVVDVLEEIGVPCASPLKTVGRLESSKSFTRELLEKYQIAGNPRFKAFQSEDGLREFFDELGDDFVVKADGLKGGKGVKVSGDHLRGKIEGLAYAKECLDEAGLVVVEEKFVGQEFSLMSFCDGVHTVEMPAIQDHKRAYEEDLGPNTGGMGSYSDSDHLLPFLKKEHLREAAEITKKVAAALKEESGVLFKGIMYGGFIATKNGVRLIEYNARFGDPEAMNVLPLLKTDFVDVCEAIIAGNLNELDVQFEDMATVCKYLVPNGYPDKSVAGEKIVVGEVPEGVLAYYSSVDQRDDGLYLSGSRAIAFVGVAKTIFEAERLAESAVSSVKGPVFYRKDIGTAELIGKRIKMMEEL
jgi:phosphoribosylamine--glycine ligase